MNLPMDPSQACAPNSRCELEQNLEILRKVSAFAAIPTDRLKLYAYLSKRYRYRTGEFLFRQGEADDKGYIVLSGKAQVIREFEDHSVILKELEAGEFFGGLTLLSEMRRLFAVRALSHLECLTLDRTSFRKLLVQFPEVGVKVLDMMIRRIFEMEEKLLQSHIHECVYT